MSPACGFDSAPGDVVLPIYLDSAATQVILLPLRSLHLQGAVNGKHDCIGRYNAAGLDPANSCLPDQAHPDFVSGAQADGFTLLEDADKVVIGALNETLCALLTGNTAMYGSKDPTGLTVCKRDASLAIVFKGDWCAATNQSASMGCADALQMMATFAAQAVTVQ